MSKKKLFLGTKQLACSALAAGVILAQPAAAQIEEIIVTAQKRAESIMDTAVAVSAMSGDALRSENVSTPRDLFTKIPNVSIQTNSTAGQLQLGIRGVSFATFSPIGVQPVMVFQDEVVLNSPQTAGLFIFDAERIEVLRGPQNTLYGRNTTAGAVNFISNKPLVGEGLNGYADLTLGNNETVDINAAVGGELSDNAAFRFAVQSLNNEGHWSNLGLPNDRLGERNQNLVRAQIKWDASDDTSWLFNLHGGVSRGGKRPIKAHGLIDAGGGLCGDLDIDSHSSTCVGTDGLVPNGNTDEAYSELRNDIDDIEAWGGSIRVDRDYGNFSLMSLTAYETNEYDGWEDNDGLLNTSFVLFRQKSETNQFTQEIRLTSDDSGELRWIAGGFVLIEDAELFTTVPILVDIPEVAFAANSNITQDTDMYSVFGQVEKDLSDNLTLTAGLRYVYEKKEGVGNAQFSVGLNVIDINNPDLWLFPVLGGFSPDPAVTAPFSATWNQWGGKIGLDYTTQDDGLVYASISRGEKGGQFSDAPEAILEGIFQNPAEPEEVIAYEAGYKKTWADNTIQTNLAVFFNDYQNQHVQITVPTPNGGLAATVVNAAESESYGLEFDAIFAPGDGWNIDFAVGLLNTEVTKSTTTALGGATIEQGRNLTNAPELTINAGITKETLLENGATLTVNLNARYTDEREFNLVDTAATRAFTLDPDYTLINGFVEYRFGDDSEYKISVWGKNLTDELYFNHIQEFGIDSTIGYASEPRTYGVSAGIDF